MANKPETKKRDCIIFLPGIGDSVKMDQSVDGISYRISRACDLSAGDDAAEFYQKVKAVEELNDCGQQVATVYRKDVAGETAIVDVYRFEYRSALNSDLQNSTLLMKTLKLVLVLPGSCFRISRAFLQGKRSKTRIEYFQLMFALGILSLFLVYGIILLSALAGTIGTINPLPQPEVYAWLQWAGVPANILAWFKGLPNLWEWLKILSPKIVILSATVALFLPPKFDLKEAITQAAVNYLSLIYYLNFGEGRGSAAGKLETLIDDLLRKSSKAAASEKEDDVEYRQIHIMAYSFGSIVALDSIFPAGRKPGAAFEQVNTLVTVGCPFDFVRSFWPRYFDKQREFISGNPHNWINVYSPLDVLASNFRNDPQSDEAVVNIRGTKAGEDPEAPVPSNIRFAEGLDYTQLSFTASLAFMGLRSHATYWGATRAPEINCFKLLVNKIFAGHPALK